MNPLGRMEEGRFGREIEVQEGIEAGENRGGEWFRFILFLALYARQWRSIYMSPSPPGLGLQGSYGPFMGHSPETEMAQRRYYSSPDSALLFSPVQRLLLNP